MKRKVNRLISILLFACCILSCENENKDCSKINESVTYIHSISLKYFDDFVDSLFKTRWGINIEIYNSHYDSIFRISEDFKQEVIIQQRKVLKEKKSKNKTLKLSYYKNVLNMLDTISGYRYDVYYFKNKEDTLFNNRFWFDDNGRVFEFSPPYKMTTIKKNDTTYYVNKNKYITDFAILANRLKNEMID